MAVANADDGIGLYYEEWGPGTPIVFVHECGGTHRSWEPQMRRLSRRHPSAVAPGVSRISQGARAVKAKARDKR